MSKERMEEIKEPFANLEKIKVDLLKGKILDGLDEFKNNKGRQWTELRFEKPLLEKLLSTIEQAERVQELEETNKKNYWIAADFKFENLKLEQQNKELREALEFYADRDNYKLEHFDPNLDDYMSTVDYDEGQKARQTIGSEKIND